MRERDADSLWMLGDEDADPLLSEDSFPLTLDPTPSASPGSDPFADEQDLRLGEDDAFLSMLSDEERLDLGRSVEEDAFATAAAAGATATGAAMLASLGVDADQPLPRIRIYAACERPEVARGIEQASLDRRATRAHFTVETGGLEGAIARFAGETSPDLLILDTIKGGRDLLAGLDRLAEVLEPGCKVMILGAANDILLYRQLMKVGVSEYLVAPVPPVQLLNAIAGLYADPDKPFAGRVAAILGARGGVGASTIAHNIAWCISEQQRANATLVDLDLAFGTAALDFNEDPGQTILDALSAADRVDEVFLDRVMSRPTERLQLFSAPAKLERALELDPDAVSQVLDKVRRTSPHIVLDLPHSWNRWMQETVTRADDIVVIASPDLSSLRNAKHIVELAQRSRPNDAPPLVVLNMVGVPKRPEIPSKDFGEHVGAPVIMEIPFDPAAFGAAANNGQMLLEAAPAARCGQLIAELAAKLTGREIQPVKRPSLLARLPLLKR